MTILGGIGTLWGGVIGAAIVLEVRDLLSNAPEASGVVTGAVFVVIVLAFRRGLWASAVDALRWIRARRSVIRGPGARGPREVVGP